MSTPNEKPLKYNKTVVSNKNINVFLVIISKKKLKKVVEKTQIKS